MRELVITFHTHLGAMKLYKSLVKQKLKARMVPVPRALSSDCGSCVRAEYEGRAEELLTADAEAVYLDTGEGYTLLASAE